MNFPKVEERPVYWRRLGRKTCPGHKAIVNADNGQVFAVATKRYNLIRHEQALDIAETAIAKNPEFGQPEPDIRLLDDGARLWATYRFPQTEYDIGGGDKVNPTIELMNSYDLGWSFSLRFGAYRLVCSNGLVVGKTFVWYKHRHTRGLELERIQQILCQGMEKYSEQVELWRSWLDKVTTSVDYERVIEGIGFNGKEKEALHEEVEISSDIKLDDLRLKTLSYWMFYNLVAQYVTHKVFNQIRRANMMARMSRLF